MGTLPPSVWAAIAGIALVLCALCAGVLVAVLRAPARRRIARWPATFLLELVTLAIVPWLVVVFAPITIRISISGLLALLAWILVALVAFGLLVILPIAAVASSIVWWRARRRRDEPQASPSSLEPPA
jgi:hypothetical protein